MIQQTRILFVNRMAGMERGGGETFDLEIARHLAELGCEVTVLTGRPVIGRARLGPREWWGNGLQVAGCRSQDSVESLRLKVEGEEGEDNFQHPTSHIQRSSNEGEKVATGKGAEPSTFNLQPLTDSQSQVSRFRQSYGGQASLKSKVFFLRSPWLGWFPWDKVRGGWRVRAADIGMFEWRAARWAWRHRAEFDVIQICELPGLVHYFRKYQQASKDPRVPKLFMRLTGPYLSDPKKAVYKLDGIIASGATLEYAKRRKDWPGVYEIANGVDLERFKVEGSRLKGKRVAGQYGERLETRDLGLETGEENNVQRSTFNAQLSSNEGIVTKGGAVKPSTCNLQPATCNQELNTTNQELLQPVLLYVARFQAFKNHDLMLRAFARVKEEVPGARLVLVGSGPLEPRCREQANELGIAEAVEFRGEVAFGDMPAIYAETDIEVISSTYESFCFVAIEAMAAGLPLVITDAGYVTRLIGDETPLIIDHLRLGEEPDDRFPDNRPGLRIRRAPGGLIAHRNDEASLAKALAMMIEDSALRKTCAAWNRAKAEREHGWESSARKLLRVYEDVTGNRE